MFFEMFRLLKINYIKSFKYYWNGYNEGFDILDISLFRINFMFNDILKLYIYKEGW